MSKILNNTTLLNTYSIIKNEDCISFYDKQKELIKEININSLSDSDKGKIYERYVGLYYESKGYNVLYNGILSGFLDGGVDLICKLNNNTILVQCKCTHKSFEPQKIEWLLYKTSGYFKNYGTPERFSFVIVVPNIDDCFSKKNKDYLLRKNNFLSNGKIELQEMELL